MNNIVLKQKIRDLRKKGFSYTEIQKKLNIQIPKSTMSYICQKLKLTSKQQQRLKNKSLEKLKMARKKAIAVNRTKRNLFLKHLYQQNLSVINKIDKNALKIALALLYLGEGAKWAKHRRLTLGSSDPNIIRIYISLLKICYGISAHDLHCRIQYRHDQDIKKLEKYWSNLTKIPLKNFYKTKADPRTKGKPTKNNNYKGVCVVGFGSTKIQLELEFIAQIFFNHIKGL